jgi:penicillin-binding protein 1A
VSFLTPEKTFRRKLQEAVSAQRLERAFTKNEILELYLNTAYFGDGLYGVFGRGGSKEKGTTKK